MKLMVSQPEKHRGGIFLLILWGAFATGLLLAGKSGTLVLLTIAPFALLGVGLAGYLSLNRRLSVAMILTLVLGIGLASVTVFSQLLVLTGQFSPAGVLGLQTMTVMLLWMVHRGRG